MWAAALIPGGMLESWLHPISVRIAPRNTSALPRHEVHGAHDPSRHASHDPHAPWEATKAEARLAIERAWALSADRSLRAALVESETERLASAWEAITQQAWALHLIGAWDAAIDEVNPPRDPPHTPPPRLTRTPRTPTPLTLTPLTLTPLTLTPLTLTPLTLTPPSRETPSMRRGRPSTRRRKGANCSTTRGGGSKRLRVLRSVRPPNGSSPHGQRRSSPDPNGYASALRPPSRPPLERSQRRETRR